MNNILEVSGLRKSYGDFSLKIYGEFRLSL